MAGMVLLLRVWLLKRILADMKDVYAVVDFLDDAEKRYIKQCWLSVEVAHVTRRRPFAAGRLKDSLRALASVGDFPLPILPSAKRPRVEDFDRPLATLRVPPVSQQHLLSPYSTKIASDDSQRSAKHVLVPPTSSEMPVFGPPLARREDGLYVFDPASTGISTGSCAGTSTASDSRGH